MSKSYSDAKVRLRVHAPDSVTEIFIVNSRFKRIASGLGNLAVDLVPGIYKVRFRSGREQKDKLVEVTAEQPEVVVTTEPLKFSSVAPLANTRSSHEHHLRAAETGSKIVHFNHGEGSQLYIFARDLLDTPNRVPWAGVSLHDIKGNLITDLTEGVCDGVHNYAALNIELTPGTYRLRVDNGSFGIFEMFLVTSPGWQTQTFLAAADFQAGEVITRRAALKTASVFMARLGRGYQPNEKHVRWTELARQGLVTGRNVVKSRELIELLNSKFENPMLGIYGTHLLLQSYRPNHELIDVVIRNLKEMVGMHADVEALRIRHWHYKRRPEGIQFHTPPMLRSSWELIVKASLQKMTVVPEGSIADRLSNGLLGTAPWLLHQVPEVQEDVTAGSKISFAKAQRSLEEMVSFNVEQRQKVLGQIDRDMLAFTPLEQKIFSAAFETGKSGDLTLPEREKRKGLVSVPQLFRDLDAPAASIARSTSNLMNKLGLKGLVE